MKMKKTPAIILSLLALFIVDSTVLCLLVNQLEIVRIIAIAIINGLAGYLAARYFKLNR